MARDPDYDRISRKAHDLWEAEGRPHGRDQDHWDQAREIIAIEDSQGDTLLPRDTGAEEPIEDSQEALRNLADFPNLTDQGENLLTSTDREPKFAGDEDGMPSVEVPTSDQPGIPSKPKGKTAKPDATPRSTSKPATPVSASKTAAAQPRAASIPNAGKPDVVKSSPTPATVPPKGRKKG